MTTLKPTLAFLPGSTKKCIIGAGASVLASAIDYYLSNDSLLTEYPALLHNNYQPKTDITEFVSVDHKDLTGAGYVKGSRSHLNISRGWMIFVGIVDDEYDIHGIYLNGLPLSTGYTIKSMMYQGKKINIRYITNGLFSANSAPTSHYSIDIMLRKDLLGITLVYGTYETMVYGSEDYTMKGIKYKDGLAMPDASDKISDRS